MDPYSNTNSGGQYGQNNQNGYNNNTQNGYNNQNCNVISPEVARLLKWMDWSNYNCNGNLKEKIGNGIFVTTMTNSNSVIQWETQNNGCSPNGSGGNNNGGNSGNIANSTSGSKKDISFNEEDFMITNFNGQYLLNNRNYPNPNKSKLIARTPQEFNTFMNRAAGIVNNGGIWPLSNYSYIKICPVNPPPMLVAIHSGKLVNLLYSPSSGSPQQTAPMTYLFPASNNQQIINGNNGGQAGIINGNNLSPATNSNGNIGSNNSGTNPYVNINNNGGPPMNYDNYSNDQSQYGNNFTTFTSNTGTSSNANRNNSGNNRNSTNGNLHHKTNMSSKRKCGGCGNNGMRPITPAVPSDYTLWIYLGFILLLVIIAIVIGFIVYSSSKSAPAAKTSVSKRTVELTPID
jgi:hypothetical protein